MKPSTPHHTIGKYMQTLRQEVAEMSDAEAREYLLLVDEARTNEYHEQHRAFRSMLRRTTDTRIGISKTATLIILWNARNKLVSKDHLADNLEFLANIDAKSPYAATTDIKMIRKFIKQMGWPIEIITDYGMGHMLMAPKEFILPGLEKTT